MSQKPEKERQTSARRNPSQTRSRELVKAVREAGRLLLRESGPEGLTTTRIAERAGVSVGSLYQYFEDKEAVLNAIHDEIAEELRGGVPELAAAIRDMDPKARIRAGIEYAVNLQRSMMKLDADYYREHHEEFRLWAEILGTSKQPADLGHEAVRFAREVLRTSESELKGWVNIEHGGFLLGRGIPAILQAALEDSPELLEDQGFIDELVKMVTRYIYPGGSPDTDR